MAVANAGPCDRKTPFLLMNDSEQTHSLCKIQPAHVHKGQVPAVIEFRVKVDVSKENAHLQHAFFIHT